MTPARVVIDGQVLVDDHFSGVGQYTAALLHAVDAELVDRPDVDVKVAVPFKRVPQLERFGFDRLPALPIPLTLSRQRRLLVADRLPPMDLALRKGTYLFPNFSRWPLARSRSVTTVHDLSFVTHPEVVDPGNREFLQRAVQQAVERSDRVTTLTDTIAGAIADHYRVARDRIDVVSPAVDPVRFYRRSVAEVAAVTARYGIYGDYVLSVGNLEPRKNQARLVAAFCALPRDVSSSLSLVLVGSGAWRDEEVRACAERAVRSGHRVQLLVGSVSNEDLPALYTGARASAFVSMYEGFGMPPLESMACQTPVVSSDASVMPEVAGEAARLVDVLRPDAIADGLLDVVTLAEADRHQMVQRGLANVRRYDWARSARTLLDALGRAGGWAA